MNTKVITAGVVTVIAVIGIGAAMLAGKGQNSKSSSSGNESHMGPRDKQSETKSAETQESDKVTYKNFEVSPKVIKVKKGTTVTWTNEDTAKHDVTPDNETADFKASELFGKGETFEMTFNTPGTYTYHCSPHPYMKGTVEVTE